MVTLKTESKTYRVKNDFGTFKVEYRTCNFDSGLVKEYVKVTDTEGRIVRGVEEVAAIHEVDQWRFYNDIPQFSNCEL